MRVRMWLGTESQPFFDSAVHDSRASSLLPGLPREGETMSLPGRASARVERIHWTVAGACADWAVDIYVA